MNEEDNKTLSFVLLVIRILLTISLIGLIARFLIWLVWAIIGGYEAHSQNKALKNVIKLFYKWQIEKKDLVVKEVKKLKKALDISGIKRNVTMEDLKNAQYVICKGQPYLRFGEVIHRFPTLKECGVKVN